MKRTRRPVKEFFKFLAFAKRRYFETLRKLYATVRDEDGIFSDYEIRRTLCSP